MPHVFAFVIAYSCKICLQLATLRKFQLHSIAGRGSGELQCSSPVGRDECCLAICTCVTECILTKFDQSRGQELRGPKPSDIPSKVGSWTAPTKRGARPAQRYAQWRTLSNPKRLSSQNMLTWLTYPSKSSDQDFRTSQGVATQRKIMENPRELHFSTRE